MPDKNPALQKYLDFIRDLPCNIKEQDPDRYSTFVEILIDARDDWCVTKNRHVCLIIQELESVKHQLKQ